MAPYRVLVHQWLVSGQLPVEHPMKYQYDIPAAAPSNTGKILLKTGIAVRIQCCMVIPQYKMHFKNKGFVPFDSNIRKMI